MSFSFIRNLFHVTEKIGFDNNEIEEVVKHWGALPAILKQYYQELGKHKIINRSQNILRRPHDLIDAGEYLIFYIENQNCAEWGIKKEDLMKDNPAVYCRKFDGDFSPESNTLTEFLNAMSLLQAASWGLSHASDIFMITEEQAKQIRNRFTKKPYELKQWMEVSFYGNHDDEVIMLIVNDDYDLIFASEDERHYKQMEEFMKTLNLEEY